ncbi:MAG: T9SS type A sorting domain-containing protein, partial [Ferruginibacter sp.]
ELWAGTTVTAVNAANFQTSFASNIPFTASATKMNVRVWSPHAGIKVRLKVEDKNDPTRSCETEATVTTASGWQTLEFNFANQATGTAALNLAFSFNKASIFFNFGVTGATAGERIYYFDDMRFGAIPPPPAPVVTAAVSHCQNSVATPLTATAASGNTLLWYTTPTGGTGSAVAPTPTTTVAGTTNYYVSQINASLVEGPRAMIAVTVNAAPAAPTVNTPVSICQNSATPILNATAASGSTLNWYTVATGGTASTTVPSPATNTAGTSSYYVSQTNSQGCQSSRAAINVTINALPAAPVITAGPYTKLFPGLTTTLAVSNTTGTGNIYEWFRNDIMLPGQTANTLGVNIDGLGNYKMQITNASGCSNTSNVVMIADSSNSKLFVYPNPSTGKFQVRYLSDVSNLQPRTLAVYDSKGALIYQARYVMFGAYTSIYIDLGKRSPGIYTVYLMDNDGKKLNTEPVIIYR